MTQTWYTIEPKAPLVFRTAKPFGAGSRDGANFPWPSSLAGLMRTQTMDARRLQPWRDDAHKQELLALAAVGPFPAECDEHGHIVETWLPKPTDAVLIKDETSGAASYHRLAPSDYGAGAGSDLPSGLMPVCFSQSVKGKPQPGPAWWPLAVMVRWMQGEPVDVASIASRCDPQPWQVASRTHVGIDRNTFAAESGRLFQTDGLDFDNPRLVAHDQAQGWQARRFKLLARGPAGIGPGMVTFGGERRLSWMEQHLGEGVPAPAHWSAQLTQGFALTLATPALFSQGWRPGWLNDHLEGEVPGIPGLRVRLRAAVLERWQGVSGWDLAAQKPRASRKAASAGATYWFERLTGDPAQLSQLWLTSISDAAQDRRDGFGIALSRPWNPQTAGETHA